MDIRKKCGLSQGAFRRLEANYEKMKINVAKRDVRFELSLYEYIKLAELAQSGTTKCFYTGVTLSTKLHSPSGYSLERLSDRHPYRIDNIVLVTRESNVIKDAIFDKRHTRRDQITARMWDIAKRIERNFNDVERREKQRDYIINYCSEGDYRPPKFEIKHSLSIDHNVSRGIVADDLPPSVSNDVAIAQQYLAFYEEHRHNNFDLSFSEFSKLISNAKCQLRGYSLCPSDALVLVRDGEAPVTIANCTVISRKAKEEFFKMAISVGLNNAFASLQVQERSKEKELGSPVQKAQKLIQNATPTISSASPSTPSAPQTPEATAHAILAQNEPSDEILMPEPQPPARDSVETHIAKEKAKGLQIFDKNDRLIVRVKNCNLSNQICVFRHYFVSKDNILMMSVYLLSDPSKKLTIPYSYAFTLKEYNRNSFETPRKEKEKANRNRHRQNDGFDRIRSKNLNTRQLTSLAYELQE